MPEKLRDNIKTIMESIVEDVCCHKCNNPMSYELNPIFRYITFKCMYCGFRKYFPEGTNVVDAESKKLNVEAKFKEKICEECGTPFLVRNLNQIVCKSCKYERTMRIKREHYQRKKLLKQVT